MKKNMGTLDRAIRIILAVLVGFLFYTGIITGIFGTILLILALVILVTGFIGWCGIYSLMGISTYHQEESAQPPNNPQNPPNHPSEPPSAPPTVPPTQA